MPTLPRTSNLPAAELSVGAGAIAPGGVASPRADNARLASAAPEPTYEQLLAADLRWALDEASLFFGERGRVHEALRKIVAHMNELGVDYAIAGGMALFSHGFRRFTEDVDILVTADGLRRIHDELSGRGYVPPFAHSKNLRDADLRVKIEFLIAGQFPGDGKPKPLAFPTPAQASVELAGVKFLTLSALIELKLASGLTSPDRRKDLIDVQELMKVQRLSLDFAAGLHPFVQAEFARLWTELHAVRRTYLAAFALPAGAVLPRTIADLALLLPAASAQLQQMDRDGLVLDTARDPTGRTVFVTTTDPQLAEKYALVDEADYWPDNP